MPGVVRVAAVRERTQVEGPGLRFALWVQGCRLACQGCCNPEMLSLEGGDLVQLEHLQARMAQVKGIEGISFLGGEPFLQAAALADLAAFGHNLGLNVLVYTGYSLARLKEVAAGARRIEGLHASAVKALLEEVDILVDGPWMAELASSQRRYVGSSNQGIHALNKAFQGMVDAWPVGDAGLELRYSRGRMDVTGSPKYAGSLWYLKGSEEGG